MELLEKINGLTDEGRDKIVEYRRWLHENPELSGNEKETAAYVTSVLKASKIEIKRNIGGYVSLA